MKLGNPRDEAWKPLLCMSLPSTHFIPPRLTLMVNVGVKTWLRPTADIPAIIGVPLSGASRIVGAEKSRRFIFEFFFVGVSSIEPGFVAEVMVNAAAVLVRIVRQKADGTPVVRQ